MPGGGNLQRLARYSTVSLIQCKEDAPFAHRTCVVVDLPEEVKSARFYPVAIDFVFVPPQKQAMGTMERRHLSEQLASGAFSIMTKGCSRCRSSPGMCRSSPSFYAYVRAWRRIVKGRRFDPQPR